MAHLPKLLITGSCGLVGSEAALYFGRRGFEVTGIDSHRRAVYFGPEADTRWMEERLCAVLPNYQHLTIDVRDRRSVLEAVERLRPELIVHAAAQPSHDRASAFPFLDFDTNATGTINLLEAARQHTPSSPFVHLSTNKVYGDAPNRIPINELETRWDYADPAMQGVDESCSTDQATHSLFGASKLAADVMVQEYGRYFGMPTCCLRAGCITGPNHSGVEMHGFLSYLVRCNLEGRPYKIFGYQGKQVRDNIHAEDIAALILEFYRNPRSGEVYNVGGGRGNSCSILEANELVEAVTGRATVTHYQDDPRLGDHICYYTDMRKLHLHYSNWRLTWQLPRIVEAVAVGWRQRLEGHNYPVGSHT